MQILPPFARRLRRKVMRQVAPNKLFTGQVLTNPSRKCTYLAIPKCANSSLKTAFMETLDLQPPGHLMEQIPPERLAFSPLHDKAVANWMREQGRLIHRDQVLPKQQDYVRVAVLRDPMSRLRSCWKDKINKEPVDNWRFVGGIHRGFLKYGDLLYAGMTFESFVEAVHDISDEDSNPHFRSQIDFLRDSKNRLLTNHIMFLETLSEDLSEAPEVVQDCFAGVGRKNYTGSETMPGMSDKTRARFRERYSKDYEFLSSLEHVPFAIP